MRLPGYGKVRRRKLCGAAGRQITQQNGGSKVLDERQGLKFGSGGRCVVLSVCHHLARGGGRLVCCVIDEQQPSEGP